MGVVEMGVVDPQQQEHHNIPITGSAAKQQV
jgi:hypothetical protein